MKYTFVHLSDFHYRQNWPEQIGVIQKAFLDDIKDQIESCTDPYLIFSGDIVNAGGDSESYASFEREFGQKLGDLGILPERRIIVPGNHDIAQDTAEQLVALRPAIVNCKNEELFNNKLYPSIQGQLQSKFTRFFQFCESFSRLGQFQTNLEGYGIDIDENLGVFCLNTALCSYGGCKDHEHNKIDDKEALCIATKIINQWVNSSKHRYRILVMHHPLSWLSDWARFELNNIIKANFHIVFTGHEHTQDIYSQVMNDSSTIMLEAPALFTRKDDELGYAVSELDLTENTLTVKYRTWVPRHRKFVLGVSFSGNEHGYMSFPICSGNNGSTLTPTIDNSKSIRDCLHRNLNRALECYQGTSPSWVTRKISGTPETNIDNNTKTIDALEVLGDNEDVIIKAPAEFGLSTLGRKFAYEAFANDGSRYAAVVDASQMKPHESAVREAIEQARIDDTATESRVSIVIVDNWEESEDRHVRMANNIKKEFPNAKMILLAKTALDTKPPKSAPEKLYKNIQIMFLWALNRSAMSDLISEYVESTDLPDADTVVQRVVDDMDSLCIPRIPLHCLNLLKSNEYLFDESPVNRTEVLERVLRILFYRFSSIPKYSTKPDLKDCQFALGGFCEQLLRDHRSTFTRNECLASVTSYCSEKSILLDASVLFDFLSHEKILVQQGVNYKFRYTYWLHFFAAHRMGHNKDFFDYILANQNYANCPELIEFYSGIDRHRADLIEFLTNDLRELNDGVEKRSGIDDSFNPYSEMKLETSDEDIKALEDQISQSAQESSLPRNIKNQLADRSYDRSSPYNQEIKQFLTDVTFSRTVKSMDAACRALRNSEHVDKPIKLELLREIVRTWRKMIQIGVMLAPAIAANGGARYEDFGFILGGDYGKHKDPKQRFMQVIVNLPLSISSYCHRSLFSKKNGSLYLEFAEQAEDHLSKLLGHHVVMLQRPPAWRMTINRYIDNCGRCDFALDDIQALASFNRKEAFISEDDSDQLREVLARVLIKHKIGRSKPGKKLVENVVTKMNKSQDSLKEKQKE